MLLRPAASLRTRSRGIAPRHPSRRAPPQPELTIAIRILFWPRAQPKRTHRQPQAISGRSRGRPSNQEVCAVPTVPSKLHANRFGSWSPFRTPRIGGRRTSFDARVYGQTSSHPKPLRSAVRGFWVKVISKDGHGTTSCGDVRRVRADGAVPCGAAGARLPLKNGRDPDRGGPSALMVDMVDGPRLPIRTIDHRRGLPRLPEGAP